MYQGIFLGSGCLQLANDARYGKKTEQKQTCAWMNVEIDIFVVFGWTGLWIIYSTHGIGGLRDSILLTFKEKSGNNEIFKYYNSEYENHTTRNGLLFVLVK